jgi:ribosomal protein S28E/S33
MLQSLNETYVVTAADLVPATFVGRFWSTQRKRWESATNQSASPGAPWQRGVQQGGDFDLRGVDIRVLHSNGMIASGIRIQVMIVIDPVHTGDVIMIRDAYQSATKVVSWDGDLPMGAGVQWRIHEGALVAGDQVLIGVAYEEA